MSITLPAPDLPRGPRSALIVTTGTYGDSRLRDLRAPTRDAAGLATVLGDPAVGGFTITSLANRDAQSLHVNIEDYLAGRNPDETIVVYLSCHGILTARRKLYFAASNTRIDRLASTGVEARWLIERLDDCRVRRQVVILDCCFGGAFALSKGANEDVGLQQQFQEFADQGRGRVVLTASRATEYSFEGRSITPSEAAGSVFTSALLEGLRTGAADRDGDGFVSVSEAYSYAYALMRHAGENQTPQRWLFGWEGPEVMLTRSPRGVSIEPVVLHDEIRAGLESRFPSVRIGAIEALATWLSDPDPARSVTARMTLEEVAEQDIPRVAQTARAHLGRSPAPSTRHTAGKRPGADKPRVGAREEPELSGLTGERSGPAFSAPTGMTPGPRGQMTPGPRPLEPESIPVSQPSSEAGRGYAATATAVSPAQASSNLTVPSRPRLRPSDLLPGTPSTKLGITGIVLGVISLFVLPWWAGVGIIIIAAFIPVGGYLALDKSQRRRLRAIRARQRGM